MVGQHSGYAHGVGLTQQGQAACLGREERRQRRATVFQEIEATIRPEPHCLADTSAANWSAVAQRRCIAGQPQRLGGKRLSVHRAPVPPTTTTRRVNVEVFCVTALAQRDDAVPVCSLSHSLRAVSDRKLSLPLL